MVTVGSYTYPFEAHVARGRLEAEGIPAYVADEHTINMYSLYSVAMGGVRVQVPDEYAERARAILQSAEPGNLQA